MKKYIAFAFVFLFLMYVQMNVVSFSDTTPAPPNQDVYEIKSSVLGDGTISPSGNVTISAGQSITFNIEANEGSHLSYLLVDDVKIDPTNSWTFEDVDGHHRIVAVFEEDVVYYKVNAIPSPNGTITPEGEHSYEITDNPLYTIIPDDGYVIKDVIIDGNSIGVVNGYTFTYNGEDREIKAVFDIEEKEDTYEISALPTEHGTISPEGIQMVKAGDDIVYTITPDEGYHIKDVTVDGDSVGSVNQVELSHVMSNRVIDAVFEADITEYKIEAKPTEHGMINPEGIQMVKAGDDIVYTITPDESVNQVELSHVMSNHVIDAVFEADITEYKIEAKSTEHGTISPEGISLVEAGGSIKYTITPDKGYHVKGVIIDGVLKKIFGDFEFQNIDSDHSIQVLFERDLDDYRIQISSNDGGVVLLDGPDTIQKGSSALCHIVPDEGFYIASIQIDGRFIGPTNYYQFDNITSDHNVVVRFEEYEYIALNDGRYDVEISLKDVNDISKTSYDDGALYSGILYVDDGSWDLEASLSSVPFKRSDAYISNVLYYENGLTSLLKEATTLEYIEGVDGKKWPGLISIPLSKNNTGIYIQVNVESIPLSHNSYLLFSIKDKIADSFESSKPINAGSNDGGSGSDSSSGALIDNSSAGERNRDAINSSLSIARSNGIDYNYIDELKESIETVDTKASSDSDSESDSLEELFTTSQKNRNGMYVVKVDDEYVGLGIMSKAFIGSTLLMIAFGYYILRLKK